MQWTSLPYPCKGQRCCLTKPLFPYLHPPGIGRTGQHVLCGGNISDVEIELVQVNPVRGPAEVAFW